MSYLHEQRRARLQSIDFGDTVIGSRSFVIEEESIAAPAGPGATIVPGATIAFGEGITSDLRTDLEDALLLSSLAADQKASRRYPSREWYAEYVTWLETCGFLVTTQVFQRRSTARQNFEIAKEALEIIGAISSGAASLVVLEKALTALSEQADEQGLIKLFESESNFAGDGAFQLGEAKLSGDRRVAMPLGLFAFRSSSVKRKFLFFSWDADAIELFASASEVIFNQDDYAPLRSLVQEKLHRRRSERLSRLTLSL